MWYLRFPQGCYSRSQWPRGLRRRCVAARLLRSWVRIPPGAWMFVCCECCVLSDRGLCDELITRPEESYRLRCVVVCDLETSRMRRPWPALGRSATKKQGCYWSVNASETRYKTASHSRRNLSAIKIFKQPLLLNFIHICYVSKGLRTLTL